MKSFLFCIISTLFFACQKPADDPILPPILPPPADSVITYHQGDSIRLLTSIRLNDISKPVNLNLEYDSSNRLVKFYKPYSWTADQSCHVMYKNGLVSTIISKYPSAVVIPAKASMIIVYDNQKRGSKIYYKRETREPLADDAPYFSDLTDRNLEPLYDSLVYSPTTNRLTDVFRKYLSAPSLNENIKLYYSTTGDSCLNKIESYRYYSNGIPYLYDQLLLTTNTTNNPTRNLWYFPFVTMLTSVTTGAMDPMTIDLLFDHPSTTLSGFLVYSSKCVTNYEVENNFGTSNYKNSVFNYEYAPDSSSLKGTKPATVPSWGSYIIFQFKKVRQ